MDVPLTDTVRPMSPPPGHLSEPADDAARREGPDEAAADDSVSEPVVSLLQCDVDAMRALIEEIRGLVYTECFTVVETRLDALRTYIEP